MNEGAIYSTIDIAEYIPHRFFGSTIIVIGEGR